MENLKKNKKKEVELVEYEGVGHAFMNAMRPEAYHEETAKKAFEKTVAFFKKWLG